MNDKVELTKAVLINNIKFDLLFLVSHEDKINKETDQEKVLKLKETFNTKTDKLVKEIIKFYAICNQYPYFVYSIASLELKILNYLKDCNVFEDYVYELIDRYFFIKPKHIREALKPKKTEVVYEIDLEKIKWLKM